MALLCQKAENLVAGAPCGVMDQMTCMCGEKGALLALLCQPAELQPPVGIPEELALWGIDSGERHAVGGSDYRRRGKPRKRLSRKHLAGRI
jgi:L-arabinokinase